ncbi:MAG: outer membrane beta-barrel protein [Phycisphaerae bacterium]
MGKHRLTVPLAMAALLATSGLVMADAATDTSPALMYGLDRIHVGKTSVGQEVRNAGFDIYGYVQAGYTADLSGRPDNRDTIPLRRFTSEYGNHLTLNTLSLTLARKINFDDPNYIKRGWDIGGKVEFIYGYNSDFVHANGLNFYHSYANNVDTYPLYQFDPLQFYVTGAIHLGKMGNLKVKAGKFMTLMGYESFNPVDSPFYSHSLSFTFGIPVTQTGVLVEYAPNSQWAFTAGVTRGWNQAFSDNNPNGVDFLGQVAYMPDSRWDFKLNLSEGPQDTGTNNPYRTLVEPIVSYTPPILNNNLTLASDTIFGNDAAGNPTTGGNAFWFSEALYQSYVVNSYLTLNLREEYYYDGAGFTVGLTEPGQTGQYGELTAGVKITPFPTSNLGKNFFISPEIREDLADHGVLTNGKHYQTTIGIDAVYSF